MSFSSAIDVNKEFKEKLAIGNPMLNARLKKVRVLYSLDFEDGFFIA